MVKVSGKIRVYTVACPFCDHEFVAFAHDIPRRWVCNSCNSRVSRDSAPWDEIVVFSLVVNIEDEIFVESISEEYE